jgi:hypothetical protein
MTSLSFDTEKAQHKSQKYKALPTVKKSILFSLTYLFPVRFEGTSLTQPMPKGTHCP